METLSLPCANRSKENLLPLQAFTNKISEFKKLAQSAREELLRSAQLEKFEDKETVFLHGDYGDKYYVVLSGSVVQAGGLPSRPSDRRYRPLAPWRRTVRPSTISIVHGTGDRLCPKWSLVRYCDCVE